MPNRNWQGGGAPNPGDWDQANNWVLGVVPIDGDTVEFLAADWVADITAGPAAPVTLISITDDAGFEAMGGANCIICYTGITVTTVNCLSDTYVSGGVIQTLNMSGGTNRCIGDTIGTANLSGAFCRTFGGAYGTINLSNGAYSHGAGETADIVNINGAGCHVDSGTYDVVNMNVSLAEVRTNPTITTLYVWADLCEVSALGIAAGNITNGPYIMARNLVLNDYVTGEVMCDTNQVEPNHEGRW